MAFDCDGNVDGGGISEGCGCGDREAHGACRGVEPLPSVIANFITAFFGTITQTQDPVTHKWTWVLPCDLDAGIPGFPRIAGEGLACYLARILSTQVVGLNGKNAFALTTADSTQPAISGTVTIPIDNPGAFFANEYVAASVGGF